MRIAVAVQPTLFREILSRQLRSVRDFRVVGSASDEDQVRNLVSKMDPQILLLDYEGMGPNAESIIRLLRRDAPATRILVMASQLGDEGVGRVLRAGACGLAGKELELSALMQAIRSVAAGEMCANGRASSLAILTQPAAGSEEIDLTEREKEITEACSRGLRNKEIAKALNITEKTVKAHLHNIYRKLHVGGRLALARRILEAIQPKT